MKNEMMDRPVVKEEIVAFMRERLKKFDGKIGQIEQYANERRIPIIPHETAVFLNMLVGQIKPKQILEIGTAIGFSGSILAQYGEVTTIDRFDIMISRAKENFKQAGFEDNVTLLEGDAADILPTLDGPYDFIFMDSAKSKYIEFLPECLRLLKKGGVLMVDDIFQGGTILLPDEEIPRGKRAIHRKLNEFLRVVMEHPDLTSTLVPLGDGVILITKEKDQIVL